MNTLPMPIKAKPFQHQQKAFNFVCRLFGLIDGQKRGPGAALLMEMGCGKTLVAIALMGVLYQFGKVNRVLVVAPLSLLGVWRDEIARFADYPTEVVVLQGTMDKKRSLIPQKDSEALQVVVVNYESAWRMERDLLSYGCDLIICDEGHKIKEHKTSQSKGIHKIAQIAPFRLLLTGTLITNKEMDVFSQYKFVDDRIFGRSFYVFRDRFFEMTGYGLHTPSFRESRREEFLKRLHSVAFRVTKEEALDLPDTLDEIRTVQLEPKAQKLYKQLEQESYAELANAEVTAVNVLTKLLRLSQLTGGHVGDDEKNTHRVSTAKMDALIDIVDATLADGKKLVIMARFVSELDDIQQMLEKRHIGYAAVRGGVADRAEEVRRFQNDPDCLVFVGQIAAAGLGLTLTAASTMVFYSLDYSMSNFTQAQARIHRIGAKETCHYLYLVAENTIDEKVLSALRDKVDLARMLVDDYRKGLNPFH